MFVHNLKPKDMKEDQMISIQLHKSDFTSEVWNSFKDVTNYWFHPVFIGERIIRIVTWESNYDQIQKLYNFS